MGLFGRTMFSARKVWLTIAARIGIRRTGILKLRKDVRSCEYEDVQVMWQILQKHEYELEYGKFQKKSRLSNWTCFRRAHSPVLWRNRRQSQDGRRSRPVRFALMPVARRYFINPSLENEISCRVEERNRQTAAASSMYMIA